MEAVTLAAVSSPHQALADQIRDGVRVCGVLRIWGAEVFRRGDALYDVTSVQAAEDRLRIGLLFRAGGRAEQLEVEAPSGATVQDGSLRIQRAGRVAGFGREWRSGGRGPAVELL